MIIPYCNWGIQNINITSNKIQNANLYNAEWEIQKDLYLLQFLSHKGLSYKTVKVKVKTTYEILPDYI